jgi:hypothetical protein
MSRRVVLWTLLVLVLAASPLDTWLDRAMPRLLLVEMPAWLALGWVAGSRMGARPNAWNPGGLTGLAFFLGALAFWTLPRSVDAIGASEVVDQLMHASLLAGGAGLALSVPSMPFVVRGALGIYGVSMTFALGMLYASYRALLCGTFDLVQQRATGQWLLVASPFLVVLVLGGGARALDRENSGHVDPDQPGRA